MSSPDGNTYNTTNRLGVANVPHRPSTDDFNGASCENAVAIADPQTQPSAEAWNTIGRTLEGLGRVSPVLLVTVATGTPPTAVAFSCANTLLAHTDITITKNGTGDVTVSWPAGSLPVSACDPVAHNTDHATAATIRSYSVTNGARVVASADVRFTLAVY